MKRYLLCLDKQYEINLGDATSEICFNYDTMLDNLIYLLQSYGVTDEEILKEITKDTTTAIKECE